MNFNWKEKMFLIILLCVLFTSLGMSFRHKPAEKMQIFPSYDWGNEEEEVLAYISANTNGNGVPYFIFDGRLAMAGAQPANVLYHAMLEALATQGQSI